MQKYRILWADDEIDLLKPHVLFLTAKGYDVTPVCSGLDAIEQCTNNQFDILFLDENMPGLSGLETLNKIKTLRPALPVIMITKSEEENLMEQAIGSKIADYLIKPINPSQILSSIKKILDNSRIVSEKTNMGYLQDFRNLSNAYSDQNSFAEWSAIYNKLVYWDIEIDESDNKSMLEVLDNQKTEANNYFFRFVRSNYESWLNNPNVDKPILSHRIFQKKIAPLIKDDECTFFILIDNLRLDQWKTIETELLKYFNKEEESNYCAILPTTTAYARNAIFAGLMPSEIERQHPSLWVNDEDDDSKNNFESELLGLQLKRLKLDVKYSYHKILNLEQGRNLDENFSKLLNNKLNTIVYNFVDMLSHARTDMPMIKELASNESAYRSLTKSWFLHSPLFETLKKIADKKLRVVITTDHGTMRVKKPYKIVGDKETTNSNLRYKQGRNLSFEESNVYFTRKPENLFLPKRHMSTTFAFAPEDFFFAYPNNYNYYVNYYRDTFQHGGISLEEMILPFVVLKGKG